MSQAYEYVTIEVTKKKPKKIHWLWRIPAMIYMPLVALFLILTGLIMSLTIIGFFFALPLFTIAIPIAVYPFAPGKFKTYKVTCPNCEKKTIVYQDREDYKCPRCRIPVAIKWQNYK
ncbi:DUF2614 family zinc ribbon-containing protein [Ornithinibacillus bavariensis]|uniref:DUF2614 family zinc ribbon-containing protein n=1 Tax=Ornithinibacillus bavariensis TaxID=545502 RepID=UPI000EDBAD04|nr:hypothetical protein [Ornithinibacillus sp.]